MSLPFAQLQVFVVVARLSSFSAAARELGMSRSAVSQAVRHLEEQLETVLMQRTTRSVALTDAGRRLMDGVAPVFAQTAAALVAAAARPGEVVGRLRLSLPSPAVPLVFAGLLPTFRARHPRVELEIVIDDKLVDIVGDGFDAGIRHDDIIARDMVRTRVTRPMRYLVVGGPGYLARHGYPESPDDLLAHECITFRSATTQVPYAWDLEREGQSWRVPVRGHIVVSDGGLCAQLAALDLGLAYASEPAVADAVRAGRLEIVLPEYACATTGYFLYYPSRAQRTAPLRAFVETVQDLAPA